MMLLVNLNGMKKIIVVLVLVFIGCKGHSNKKIVSEFQNSKTIITEDYELVVAPNQEALLILFPGAGGNSKSIKREFNIVNIAKKKNVSLLSMNYSRKLWVENDDCVLLEKRLEAIVKSEQINVSNVYIGGMSIGGNVAIRLSDYLIENSGIIKPKGVFIVDSPIDLYGLYESSIKDIKRKDFSEERLAEPKGIINYFESVFGKKDSLLVNIQKVAPFTLKVKNYENINNLKKIKLNLYIEPDKKWYKDVRQTDFESTNAYSIQEMYKVLRKNGWQKVRLIETENKGYRNNGERNPHSWSIVDVNDLIEWML